jgi:glycosyltransferase involved in cell wall biosynthesis
MRIAFDGTTLTSGRTGVGYYTEHLLQHLAREVVRTGDELIVISNQRIDTASPLPAHVRVFDRYRFPLRIGWLQLVAPRVLAELKPDVAHFTNGMIPPFAGVPTVVTIHDMSLRLYPRCHPVRRLLINRPLLSVAMKTADAIVTVSHSARRDLLRLHRVDPRQVSVVHEAAGSRFAPIDDATLLESIRRRHNLPHRFMLYVGTIEPRKNLPRLIRAFAAARKAGIAHDLVCVGPYGWSSRDLTDVIDECDVRKQVHFTGYVPAEDLAAIYNLAEIFVFPSMYEGFGLPVVEAMACGVPIITASTSSLGEIASGAAETVDPGDTIALTSAIIRLATDPARRAELRALALARARNFSWARAAREMLGVYARAAGLVDRDSSGLIDRDLEPQSQSHPAPEPALVRPIASSDVGTIR